MKQSLIILSLILTGAFSLNAQSYSESELQKLFMDMLEDNGFEGWIDSDGDIQFEDENFTLFIEVNEDDNEFFRVVLPDIWPIESNEEAVAVAFAVNEVNATKKTVKAYTTNDNVWIAVEMFVDDPRDVRSVFMRSLDVIYEAVDLFVEEM